MTNPTTDINLTTLKQKSKDILSISTFSFAQNTANHFAAKRTIFANAPIRMLTLHQTKKENR